MASAQKPLDSGWLLSLCRQGRHGSPQGVIAEDVHNPTLSSLQERREPVAERAVFFREGIQRRPGVVATGPRGWR
jgi:hypothetical protein